MLVEDGGSNASTDNIFALIMLVEGTFILAPPCGKRMSFAVVLKEVFSQTITTVHGTTDNSVALKGKIFYPILPRWRKRLIEILGRCQKKWRGKILQVTHNFSGSMVLKLTTLLLNLPVSTRFVAILR